MSLSKVIHELRNEEVCLDRRLEHADDRVAAAMINIKLGEGPDVVRKHLSLAIANLVGAYTLVNDLTSEKVVAEEINKLLISDINGYMGIVEPPKPSYDAILRQVYFDAIDKTRVHGKIFADSKERFADEDNVLTSAVISMQLLPDNNILVCTRNTTYLVDDGSLHWAFLGAMAAEGWLLTQSGKIRLVQ